MAEEDTTIKGRSGSKLVEFMDVSQSKELDRVILICIPNAMRARRQVTSQHNAQ
jgi:hypothetical protein